MLSVCTDLELHDAMPLGADVFLRVHSWFDACAKLVLTCGKHSITALVTKPPGVWLSWQPNTWGYPILRQLAPQDPGVRERGFASIQAGREGGMTKYLRRNHSEIPLSTLEKFKCKKNVVVIAFVRQNPSRVS
jgi:hypothetical protein